MENSGYGDGEWIGFGRGSGDVDCYGFGCGHGDGDGYADGWDFSDKLSKYQWLNIVLISKLEEF